MKARDVMASPVVTVKPSASVKEVAKLLLQRRISAVPAVDDQDKVVGIVSEGDLLHRTEGGESTACPRAGRRSGLRP
jgi:CBS domain-containing protein